MARPCTICQHPERDAIDRAVLGFAALSKIAAAYRVSEDALSRHKAAHLAETLKTAKETREVQQAKVVEQHAIEVMEQLKIINRSTLTILKEARDVRDHNLALRAIDRVQRQIELQAKLLGDFQPDGSLNITINAEWIDLRTAIMAVLEAHPAAKHEVIEALRRRHA